jgi:hypothetical protein
MPPPLPPNIPGSDRPPVIPPALSPSRSPAAPLPPKKDTTASQIIRWSVILFVVVVVGFLSFRVYQFSQFLKHRPPHQFNGRDALNLATELIGPKGPTESGNTKLATDLAADLSKMMLDIRNKGFEQAKEKSLLDTKDPFKTYCELRSNECVFLLHIPELRRFNAQAQDDLGKYAWKSAQLIVARRGVGKNGMKLAVGIRGLIFYDRVLLGDYTADFSDEKTGLLETKKGIDSDQELYDWFTPVATNFPGNGLSP